MLCCVAVENCNVVLFTGIKIKQLYPKKKSQLYHFTLKGVEFVDSEFSKLDFDNKIIVPVDSK